GIKVDDSIKVTKNVLEKGIADYVILTGLVANVFLAASGTNIGMPNLEFIRSQGYDDQIDVAKEILTLFDEKIMLPVDFALNKEGKRVEVTSGAEIDYPIHDIGLKTVTKFQETIRSSKTVVVNGPAGVFEDKEFSYGTFEMLKSVSECEYGVIGGGHIVAALGELGIEEKMWHVSTGGGACISYLSGETLPGVTALCKR
ncbi:MAG: phosphoglycerate kinase, partial [Halobacteriota archaeon]|nr:phosphoglycerate kinase [Halobacteriota archaeon]